MAKPKLSLICSSAIALSITFWSGIAWAGDPFRNSNPRPIGDSTEAAFESFFIDGNYPEAYDHLQTAKATETDDPLTTALLGALAFTDENWNELGTYAQQTLDNAKTIMNDDPLRGNLYTAIGHFLEGVHKWKTQGPIGAAAKLAQVMRYMDKAKQANPSDPELNLIKGYMDLLIAVNLPLSNPEDAIANLQRNAAPSYLVNRGIAMAYRDLGQYEKAEDFVEKALAETPNNPEVIYLKAQIIHELGTKNKDEAMLEEAIALFEQVQEQEDQLYQLPPQLERELGFAQKRYECVSASSPAADCPNYFGS